jgi:hypothetical protein
MTFYDGSAAFDVKYYGSPSGSPQRDFLSAVSGDKRSRVPRTDFNVWLISDNLCLNSKSLFTIFIPEISGDSRQLYAAGPAGQ